MSRLPTLACRRSMSRTLSVATLLIAVVALLPGPAAAGSPQAQGHAPDRVLVKLRPGAGPERVTVSHRPIFDRWIEVPVPAGRSAEQTARDLEANPAVEIVQLDYLFPLGTGEGKPLTPQAAPQGNPNDPYYRYQWHFPNARVPEAWEESSGQRVVVAVIDSGVTRAGEDLSCREFVHEYDATDGSTGPGAAEDDHGHGTHVAGTIAQCTDNEIGVAGIAYQAKLMPVDVFQGSSAPTSAVARGIDWARAHGASVINLSLGLACSTEWPDCSYPIINDAVAAAVSAGAVLVGASGNHGGSAVAHPANHPDVIAVGALDQAFERTLYSAYGSALGLSAPGGDLGADLNGDGFADGVLQETYARLCSSKTDQSTAYCFLQGTSMAAAHVSGIAALLRAEVPGATPARVRAALACSAQDLGQPGWDPVYGAGSVRAAEGLDALRNDSCAPVWPLGSTLGAPDVLERSVRLEWTPALDEVAVTAYRIYLNDQLVVSTQGDQITVWVTDLHPASTYRFRVEAGDAAGHWSTGGPEKTTTTSPDFVDTNGHLLEQDIAWLAGSGITKGCAVEGPRYCPDDPVTRAQMAAFLQRALFLPQASQDFFTDDDGSPFEPDIDALAAAGVTKGCGPGRYCPDDPVTRAEMAAFLGRALGLPLTGRDYFWDDDGHPLQPEINALAAAGVTQGCGSGRYCPDDPVTRAQMAAFLRRGLTR